MDTQQDKVRPVGRPVFEITDEVLETIMKLRSLCLNKKEIAGALGITYETYNQKSKEDPRIGEKEEEGLARGISKVKKRFMEKAYDGDNHCMTKILLNYSDMSDKLQLESSGPGGGPIEKKYTVEVIDANRGSKLPDTEETGKDNND